MLKNSSRSKKLLATNSSHSGSAAAALSPLTSWAAAAGSRAAANQRQAALATPFSFATSTALPLTQPALTSTNAVHNSLQSPFDIFIGILNIQEKSPFVAIDAWDLPNHILWLGKRQEAGSFLFSSFVFREDDLPSATQ